jgi:hypothetical protein
MPAAQRRSLKDWTGYYTITFLVVGCKMSDAEAALPKGLALDKSYGQQNGSEMLYPVLLSVGSIEDAHIRVGSFLGINYYEVFSAIPGVELEQGEGPRGPFIYPYRGYLNRLLPVVLGRLSGLRKFWERVSVATVSGAGGTPPSNTEMFTVRRLFSGNPILDGEFEFGASLGVSDLNRRVQTLAELLPPNIVGLGPFGKAIRTVFDFRFDRGLAWTVTRATVNIRVPDVIPGVNQPVTITYPASAGASSLVWPEDPRYSPVRAFVPWQLKSNDMKNALAPARLLPPLPAHGSAGDSNKAAASSAISPAAGSTVSPATPPKSES